jgi:hypothetical protein
MTDETIHIAGGMEWGKWLETIGRGTSTGYDWINRGWIKVVNINGKNYVMVEAITEFWQRQGGRVCQSHQTAEAWR